MPQCLDIPSFYTGLTIFITGGSGFVGNVLLSKLLSSCPDIHKIYLLMREKNNLPIEDRIRNIVDGPVLQNIKQRNPSMLQKLSIIKGNCAEPNLGISQDDQKMMENEVNVVFHVAAAISFNLTFGNAVKINVRSTRDLLNMSTRFINLKAFVHVSTAYAFNFEEKIIEEKFYSSPIPADVSIYLAEHLDDAIIALVGKKLLETYPNMYSVSKAISEDVFLSAKSLHLPISIIRPAIVCASVNDPTIGYSKGYSGLTGVIASSGTGLLKTIHGDSAKLANIVPCDYVVNAMIASAWFSANKKQLAMTEPRLFQILTTDTPIFNYGVSDKNTNVTWGKVFDKHRSLEAKFPFSKSVWIYAFKFHKYRIVHRFIQLISHIIPAIILDSTLILCCQKPKIFSSYKRINKLSSVLEYFACNEWIVKNDNLMQLWSLLSSEDKRKFNFNLNTLDWNQYLKINWLGVREYVMNDSKETLPSARRRRKLLLFVYYLLLLLFFLVITIPTVFIVLYYTNIQFSI